MPQAQFQLISLNCLGAPFFGDTQARLRTIAEYLEASPVDVVCLQEVQMHRYARLFERRLSSYPFAASAQHIYAPKGGLITFSRWPIQHSDFEIYPVRGWWHTPSIADRLLHKGFLAAGLRVPSLPFPIIILNTHLTANYDADWSEDNRYARVQMAQVELLSAAAIQAKQDHGFIVSGDFNIPRGSRMYQQFLDQTGLSDPLAGSNLPTYRPLIPGLTGVALALDHVFVRLPPGHKASIDADVILRDETLLANGRTGRVSDHMALRLTLTAGPGTTEDAPSSRES